jgi:hypothetical protein
MGSSNKNAANIIIEIILKKRNSTASTPYISGLAALF